MEKKQNKKTEKKFQKLLANYIKIKKRISCKCNQTKYLHVKTNETLEKE